MGNPAIIDIIAAAILLGSMILGIRRGLFRTLAGLLILVLAIAGARMAAEALTPRAVALAQPVIEARIQRQIDAALEAPEPEAGRMPEENLGPEDLLTLLGVGEDRLEELADAARAAVRDTGVSVLTAVAACVTEPVLYSVLFLALFAALLVLLRLAARALDLVLKLPVLHGANALGGALVGLLEGLAVLLLLTTILSRLDVPLEESVILHRFAAWLS